MGFKMGPGSDGLYSFFFFWYCRGRNTQVNARRSATDVNVIKEIIEFNSVQKNLFNVSEYKE